MEATKLRTCFCLLHEYYIIYLFYFSYYYFPCQWNFNPKSARISLIFILQKKKRIIKQQQQKLCNFLAFFLGRSLFNSGWNEMTL